MIANPPYFVETDNKDAFQMLRNSDFGAKFYEGRMDFFYFFIEKAGSELSHPNTVITFITTNYWLTSNGAKKLRTFIEDNINLLKMLNFNEIKIFDTAQGQHNLIFIGNRKDAGKTTVQKTEVILVDSLDSGLENSLDNILDKNKSTNGVTIYNTTELFDQNGHLTAIQTNPVAVNIKKKLCKNSYYLNENDIGNGIDILQEFVNKNHIAVVRSLKLNEGVFVLNKKELGTLKLSRKERIIVKPFYTTEHLCRFSPLKNIDKYLIYADKNFTENIANYPKLKIHLDRFKLIMTSANKPYGLNRPRDEFYFKGEKILALRMTKSPFFPLVSDDSYVARTFLVIKPRNNNINLKFLSCLLNSKLSEFWFYNFGKRKGDMLQIDKEPLLNFPIKNIKDSQRKLFEDIFNNIIKINQADDYSKNNEKQTKVKNYEHLIDRMVYELYGLTEDEIKIVENG